MKKQRKNTGRSLGTFWENSGAVCSRLSRVFGDAVSRDLMPTAARHDEYAPPGRHLRLRFIGDLTPQLDSIEFQWKVGVKGEPWKRIPDKSTEKRRSLDVKLPKALADFFVAFAAWAAGNQSTVFSYSEQPKAKTIRNARESEMQHAHKVFVRADGSSCYNSVVQADPPSRPKKAHKKSKVPPASPKPVTLWVNKDILPAKCVEIFWGKYGSSALTKKSQFEELLTRIRGESPAIEGTGFVSKPSANSGDEKEVAFDHGHAPPASSAAEEELSSARLTLLPMRIGGRQTNFLIRWGLNREGGCFFVTGVAAESVFRALCGSEDQLREALGDALSGNFPRREWVLKSASQLESYCKDGGILEGLEKSQDVSRTTAKEVRKGVARLGLVIDVQDQVHSNEWLHPEVVSALSGDIGGQALCCAFVRRDPRHLRASTFLQAFAKPTALPGEVLTAGGIFGSTGMLTFQKALFQSTRHVGAALATWCQYAADKDGSATGEGEELFQVARDLLAGFALNHDESNPLPQAEAVLEDLKQRPQLAERLAAQLLDLVYRHAPELGCSLVRAMARDYKVFGRVAWRSSSHEPALVDAWLAGFPKEYLASLPDFLKRDALAQRPPLEGLLGATLRAERLGAPVVSSNMVDAWLGLADSELARVAAAVREKRLDGTAEIWKRPTDRALRLLGEFAPGVLVPINELPLLWANPVCWELVETAPFSEELIRRIAGLPPDARAVLGFCTRSEWETLYRNGYLGQSLARLRSLPSTNSPNAR